MKCGHCKTCHGNKFSDVICQHCPNTTVVSPARVGGRRGRGPAGHLAGDDARLAAPEHLRRGLLPRRAQHVLRLGRLQQGPLAPATATTATTAAAAGESVIHPLRVAAEVGRGSCSGTTFYERVPTGRASQWVIFGLLLPGKFSS